MREYAQTNDLSLSLVAALETYHQHLADARRLVEWRPIETAPREKRLLFKDCADSPHFEVSRIEGPYPDNSGDLMRWKGDVVWLSSNTALPTHWTHIDAPPAEGER